MNQWDILSDFFDVRIKNGEIQGGAMDNILIAWPPIIKCIKKHYPDTKGLSALDFGCGVGEFCFKLHKLGFKVTGIDNSEKMIKKAKSYLPKDITLIHGKSDRIQTKEKYDLITSIQTLQFIEDIRKTISNFDKALKPKGLLIFAVFNPQFVLNCIKENVLLVDFDSETNPKKGFFCLGDKIRIPTYIRTASEYISMLKEKSFKKILETYPPFTKSFLKKYPLKVPPDKLAPSKDPEYMILGFVKQ